MTTTKESQRVSEMDQRRNEIYQIQQEISALAKARKVARTAMNVAAQAFVRTDIHFFEMMEVAETLVEMNQMFAELLESHKQKTFEQQAQKRVHRNAIAQRRKSPHKQAWREKRSQERHARWVAWNEKQKVAA